MAHNTHSVMRGLDPRIHVFVLQNVDGRDKPGHDVVRGIARCIGMAGTSPAMTSGEASTAAFAGMSGVANAVTAARNERIA